LESYYLQLMTTLAAFPQLAALIRNWIAVSGNPVLEQAQQDLEEAVMPWIEEVLTARSGNRRGPYGPAATRSVDRCHCQHGPGDGHPDADPSNSTTRICHGWSAI
jgi:hypothetical protein